jgi:hypothetical protein
VDPSNYERKHDKAGRMPNWFTLEEVQLYSQNPNPKWSAWTFEMVMAALGEHQERGDRISTTTLTSACPRAEVLKRKVDYIGALDEMYAPLRGTMVHRTLERYHRPGGIPEGWFMTLVDGIEISCSPDLLTTDAVFDYKVPTDVTGVPMWDPFRHQTEQLMVNAFIARHMTAWKVLVDGVKVDNGPLPFDPRVETADKAVIVYLGPKGPKTIMVQRSVEVMTSSGKTMKRKRPLIWDDDEALTFLRPRLHVMRNALDAFPDWPEPWVDPDTGKEWLAEHLWGGPASWDCPGWPVCRIPGCLAKRWPYSMTWDKPERP